MMIMESEDNHIGFDVVLVAVPEEGHPGADWPHGVYEVYINPDNARDFRSLRRVFEMVVGRLNVRGMSRPLEPMLITHENWEHAIGLVVCGLGERIAL
jgi:hypothetical protein